MVDVCQSADLCGAAFLLEEVPSEVGRVDGDTVHGTLHLFEAGQELYSGVGVLDGRVDAGLDAVPTLCVDKEPEALLWRVCSLPQLHLQLCLQHTQLPQPLSVALNKLLDLASYLH